MSRRYPDSMECPDCGLIIESRNGVPRSHKSLAWREGRPGAACAKEPEPREVPEPPSALREDPDTRLPPHLR